MGYIPYGRGCVHKVRCIRKLDGASIRLFASVEEVNASVVGAYGVVPL